MGIEITNPGRSTASSFLARGVRNFMFSGVGTIGTAAVAFLFAGLTIRYLGMARAGYFMALGALTGINGFMGGFGLGTPAVRRVAELNAKGDLKTARTVMGSVSVPTLFSALIIAFSLLVFFPAIFSWSQLDLIYRTDAYWATVFTLGTFVLVEISNTWRAAYTGLERYDLMSAFDVVFGFMTGILGIATLIILPTMTAIAFVRLLVRLTRLIMEAYFLRKLLNGIPWPAWNWDEIRPMLSFGGWVYFGGIGELLFLRLNSLILTTFLGSAVLPFYEIPQRIYRIVHGILGRQAGFLFPMLASFGKDTIAKFKEVEERLVWIMALASGTIYTAIALVGVELLGKLVNTEFALHVRIPLYLACIQGFFHAQCIVHYHSTWAIGTGKPNSIFSLTLGVLVAFTSFVLVPRIGYIGASLAQLWVCLIAICYIIYVRPLFGAVSHPFSWLQFVVSPLAMISVWLFTSVLLLHSIPVFFGSVYVTAAVGALFGFGTLVLVEYFFYPVRKRLKTLKRIFLFSFNNIVVRYRKMVTHTSNP
jgi:O-antigen/teichoic acid export membrane protein